MKKQEMIKLLELAIERNYQLIEELKTNTNFQVKEVVQRAQGKHDAFYDVLCALRGEAVYLKIDAGK